MLIRLSTGFYGISYIFHVEVFQVSPGTGFICVCGAEHRRGGLQGFSWHRVQPRFAAQNIDEGPDDFYGCGYFYVRLCWNGCGFQAHIVEDCVLLRASSLV